MQILAFMDWTKLRLASIEDVNGVRRPRRGGPVDERSERGVVMAVIVDGTLARSAKEEGKGTFFFLCRRMYRLQLP